uniref:Uncharacterized protein n=1 Tax=Setaria viridis TaxID=4556 RepID=A0A4U6T702_SETVI|nr:hypothetical protein SEVIR_9G437450v2 [Setaria viridis]
MLCSPHDTMLVGGPAGLGFCRCCAPVQEGYAIFKSPSESWKRHTTPRPCEQKGAFFSTRC